MTVTGESPSPAPRGPAGSRTSSPSPDGVGRDLLDGVCPYLRDAHGEWRSASPTRDQACWAETPPRPLPIETQRDRCLTPAHRDCPAFLAAEAGRAARGPAGSRAPAPDDRDGGPSLWPDVRTVPLVLDPQSRVPRISGSRARAGGQALLVGLMALAFVVLVVSRTAGPSAPGPSLPAGAAASASGDPIATPAPTSSPAAPSATPDVTPTPSVAPTRTPRATPATARYRVRAGDTLSGIAVRLGTTVKVLRRLNQFTSSSVIHPGQVLVVPGP